MRKVLYVNSYHEGYVWSDDEEKGFFKAMDRSDLPIDLKVFRMDTKRNDSEEFHSQKSAGSKSPD